VSAALESGSEPYRPRGLVHTAPDNVEGLLHTRLLYRHC